MTTTEATAYNYVRRGIARTRAELARAMGVSRPTASTVTESLISSGLLRDGGKCRSTGGRSPTLLVPLPEAFSLIGVDLNGSGRLFGVRVNALGDVTERAGGCADPEVPERTAEDILALWERLDPEFDALGIGVAVGRGAADPNLLAKMLRRHLIGKYIHVAERLAAAAVSEGFRGGAGSERDYLLLPRVTHLLNGTPTNLLEMVLALAENERKKKVKVTKNTLTQTLSATRPSASAH